MKIIEETPYQIVLSGTIGEFLISRDLMEYVGNVIDDETPTFVLYSLQDSVVYWRGESVNMACQQAVERFLSKNWVI